MQFEAICFQGFGPSYLHLNLCHWNFVTANEQGVISR